MQHEMPAGQFCDYVLLIDFIGDYRMSSMSVKEGTQLAVCIKLELGPLLEAFYTINQKYPERFIASFPKIQ
jgi:hypothetical protein